MDSSHQNDIKKHMIELKINNQNVEVEEGSTVLDAANKLGISIPTMCHLKPYSNHPSCMICVVKDLNNGNLQPSCAFPAYDGMNVSTDDEEVLESRKENLQLLLSDHVGDCEAPCRVGCPAFMDIPEMNRLINENKPLEALKVVKKEIALPIVLGYVCQAPCESACRRKTVDETISICQLKKYVAIEDAKSSKPYFPEKKKDNGKSIAIVGSGISGLSAAFHLIVEGYKVSVYEKGDKAGGALVNETESLPSEMLELEIDILEKFGVDIKCGENIDSNSFNELRSNCDAVLIASGDINLLWAEELGLEINSTRKGLKVNQLNNKTNLEGVYACGSVVKKHKMSVQALENGKRVAHKIHAELQKDIIENPRDYFNSKFPKLVENEFPVYLLEAESESKGEVENHLDGFISEEAINEAGRCMHCDCRKVDNCLLRIYSHEYSADQKKYKRKERAEVQKEINHDLIVYETEKCIRCGLCVDICEKDGEALGLTYVGRGFDMRITVPFNREISETLEKVAIKCAEACPTAALALK